MTAAQTDKHAPDVAFEAICPMTEIYSMEEAIRSWGVTRRIAMGFATKSRGELAASLHDIYGSDDEDGLFELLNGIRDLVEGHRHLVSFLEAIEARILISAHDAFCNPPSDTEHV